MNTLTSAKKLQIRGLMTNTIMDAMHDDLGLETPEELIEAYEYLINDIENEISNLRR